MPFSFSAADLKATWHLIGETVEKSGEKYMQIKRFIPTYTVGGMRGAGENLVEGAPELSEYSYCPEVPPIQSNQLPHPHVNRLRSSV